MIYLLDKGDAAVNPVLTQSRLMNMAIEVCQMLSNQRIRGVLSRSVQRIAAGGLIGTIGVLAAGCSADISRLEAPSYGLAEPQAGQPRPTEPIGGRRNAGVMERNSESWPSSGPRSTLPPPSADQRMAALPSAPSPLSQPAVGPSRPYDAPKPTAAVSAPSKQAIPVTASGETVEVQQGDTLYAISKRTGASIAAIMELNNLKSPNLKPGQKLALPSGKGVRRPLDKAIARAPAMAAPSAAVVGLPAPVATAQPAVAAATDWSGSYTIKAGDSIYALARQYKVNSTEMQRVNNISDPAKVRPGTVLKVPGNGAVVANAPAVGQLPAPAPVVAASTQVAAEAPRVVQSPSVGNSAMPQPKIINKPEQVATDASAVQPVSAPASDAKPVRVANAAVVAAPAGAAAAGGAKFRWPVKGKVIAEYGKRPDGTHNDGVNLSVAAGTDVVAAEAGTVAYAGSELKGYGNLILIRHENGWVSAYAHSEQMIVKRGDAVKRGQLIAKAGKTGTVDQPQVHFELRQGSKPVDPMPHMEKQ
jgi:murein DD-endopeptidase MepM/ murein hydrolase activator NlpD